VTLRDVTRLSRASANVAQSALHPKRPYAANSKGSSHTMSPHAGSVHARPMASRAQSYTSPGPRTPFAASGLGANADHTEAEMARRSAATCCL